MIGAIHCCLRRLFYHERHIHCSHLDELRRSGYHHLRVVNPNTERLSRAFRESSGIDEKPGEKTGFTTRLPLFTRTLWLRIGRRNGAFRM